MDTADYIHIMHKKREGKGTDIPCYMWAFAKYDFSIIMFLIFNLKTLYQNNKFILE